MYTYMARKCHCQSVAVWRIALPCCQYFVPVELLLIIGFSKIKYVYQLPVINIYSGLSLIPIYVSLSEPYPLPPQLRVFWMQPAELLQKEAFCGPHTCEPGKMICCCPVWGCCQFRSWDRAPSLGVSGPSKSETSHIPGVCLFSQEAVDWLLSCL